MLRRGLSVDGVSYYFRLPGSRVPLKIKLDILIPWIKLYNLTIGECVSVLICVHFYEDIPGAYGSLHFRST